MRVPTTNYNREYKDYLDYYVEQFNTDTSKKYIVVDDDQSAIVYISRLLQKIDPTAKIHSAMTADDSRELARIFKYDVALVDLNLADKKDGLDVCLDLKMRDPKVISTIISSTSRNRFYEVSEKRNLSFPFLEKPLDVSTLRTYLQQLSKMH